jgi:hypothetical protein
MKSVSAVVLAPFTVMLLALSMVYTARSGPATDPQGQVISCSSDNMHRNYCAADVRGGVQLVRQRSDAPCIFNHSWGYQNGPASGSTAAVAPTSRSRARTGAAGTTVTTSIAHPTTAAAIPAPPTHAAASS